MKLIIFTGAPASGKSSLANEVGKRLDIDVISKDGYKIELFEKHGFSNHDEKKKLSVLGEKLMNEELRHHFIQERDIIVDNNYKNFDEIRNFLNVDKKNSKACIVICIYCVADYDILAKRYNERIQSGNRHIALYTLNQYPVIDGISQYHKAIGREDVYRIEQNVTEKTFGNNVLEINTNKIDEEFEDLCAKVIAYIEGVKKS